MRILLCIFWVSRKSECDGEKKQGAMIHVLMNHGALHPVRPLFHSNPDLTAIFPCGISLPQGL